MTPTDFSVAEKAKGGKTPPAAWVFFQRWIANPLSVGSITPSGPGLRKLIRENLTCGPDEVVVEFGAGTGAITRALLEAGIPGERIYSFEIDPHFASYVHGVYPDVNLVNSDCRAAAETLGPDLVGKVSTVVSGIPMVTIPENVQHEIVESAFSIMPEGGRFLLYSYMLNSPLKLKSLGLKAERLGFTWKNIPPASVWAYTKI